MKAYELDKFHCAGVNYQGISLLRVLTENKYLDTIYIERHVYKMKAFANLVAILTGEDTLMIISLPIGIFRSSHSLVYKMKKSI